VFSPPSHTRQIRSMSWPSPLARYRQGQSELYQFAGMANLFSGLAPGRAYFLSATNVGAISAKPPSDAGQWVQKVGIALSPTTLIINYPATATTVRD